MLVAGGDRETVVTCRGAEVQRFKDPDYHATIVTVPEKDDKEPAFVRSVCFTPCDTMVLGASEDSAVRLWKPNCGLIHTFRGHAADVNAVDSGESAGGTFVTGSSDGKAIMWDLESGKWVVQLKPPQSKQEFAAGAVMSVASSKDGRQVAIGGLDKALRLFDIRTGHQVACYSGHSDGIFGIAYSPLGQTIASCSLDGSVNIWDVTGGTRGRLDGRLDFHCGQAWCCEFSPDGRWLLTGGANGSDGCVLGHDTRILKTPWAIMGFDSPVTSLSLNQDGELCTADGRSAVKMLHLAF